MTLRRFAWAAFALLTASAPAALAAPIAELPFWSRPFPAGYAERRPACPVRRDKRAVAGGPAQFSEGCRVTLRVRD